MQAFFKYMRAAVGKFTASMLRGDFFRGSLDRLAPQLVRIGPGDRIHQQLGIGVLGIADDLFHIAGLHHRAVVEHHDVIADMISRGQVVGDVQDGDAQILVQLANLLQDRRAQEASTIETGSSAISSLGLSTRARATAMRWRWPPLNWCGKRPRVSSGRRPTRRQGILHQLAGFFFGVGQLEVLDGDAQQVIDLVEGVVDRKGILEDRLDVAAEIDRFTA